MKQKIIALIVLVALLVILMFQNTQEVVFRLFFWRIAMSQIIFLPLAVLLGFFLGYAIGRVEKKRKSG
jgi:uncharacterized integral membrane protein